MSAGMELVRNTDLPFNRWETAENSRFPLWLYKDRKTGIVLYLNLYAGGEIILDLCSLNGDVLKTAFNGRKIAHLHDIEEYKKYGNRLMERLGRKRGNKGGRVSVFRDRP